MYRERVCLIQFSTPSADFIIDSLALADLSELAPLFANPASQKIFHAVEYDLLCLKRDFGFEFANIFDTMVAARTLGWPQVGLANILNTHFGVQLDKRHQRANWGERPLTTDQLDYARMDTHYLIALRDQLEAELQRAGRLEEALEEFERLTRLPPAPTIQFNPDAFWGISGVRDLTPHQASILRELFIYRETLAEQLDRAPYRVINDQTLLEIARHAPLTLSGLSVIPGMSEGQMRRHGAALLEAVRRGQAAKPLRAPRPQSEPDAVRDRYDKLRDWRKRKAQTRGVESDVILARETLWELARAIPRTPADLTAIPSLGPWRRKMYGDELLSLLSQT